MDWNLVQMVHSMSGTAKGVVVMLLLMSALSIGLAVERGLRYAVARNQSRAFAHQVRLPRKRPGFKAASGISEALVTTALGLLVAVPAVWCYNYFTTTVENFDVEMENSSMELVSYLVRRAPRENSLP